MVGLSCDVAFHWSEVLNRHWAMFAPHCVDGVQLLCAYGDHKEGSSRARAFLGRHPLDKRSAAIPKPFWLRMEALAADASPAASGSAGNFDVKPEFTAQPPGGLVASPCGASPSGKASPQELQSPSANASPSVVKKLKRRRLELTRSQRRRAKVRASRQGRVPREQWTCIHT